MAQAQEPSVPAVSGKPDEQRLLSGVRELIRQIMRARVFLQRADIGRVIRPRTGQPSPSLLWNELNRVELNAAGTVNLPFITAEWVGVPLYLAKVDGANALTLSPTGFSPGTRTRPTINGASTFSTSAAGLRTLMSDGQNWFIS